ncbi:Sfum_1244 family protein [Sphaerotilus microaerophilus]|uniref:Uncharacterized protein n=1 Tax=Sphaerotilus microaerophilus TaxID=2914710 RepID=A0ABM7YTE3_9BURK|nr:Sfum_1244 family protein [Sphaerotilus sp. FB-5]BDI07919.1 hypothetical protein CATMQ487_48890 [Sphaerotilus sp. FB-5]
MPPADAARPRPLPGLDRLIEQVQRNCHVADARHARELSLCNYLLQMRELYRWEHDLPLPAALPRADIGRWLTERERLWEALETADYDAIRIGGDAPRDPFDVRAINDRLLPHGLVYGAGIGRFGAAHFFLAQLRQHGREQGVPVVEAGCEYARDAATLPAAFQAGGIVLRHDALRRWLWSRIEPWASQPPEGALRRALRAWGHEGGSNEAQLSALLDRMAAADARRVLAHELGEAQAEGLLGPDWARLLDATPGRRAELLLRAIRDLLADCHSTLPVLIANARHGNDSGLHFYFANLDGWRVLLFPLAGEAYRIWRETARLDALAEAARLGAVHWLTVARRCLDGHAADPVAAAAALEQFPDAAPHPWKLVGPHPG